MCTIYKLGWTNLQSGFTRHWAPRGRDADAGIELFVDLSRSGFPYRHLKLDFENVTVDAPGAFPFGKGFECEHASGTAAASSPVPPCLTPR